MNKNHYNKLLLRTHYIQENIYFISFKPQIIPWDIFTSRGVGVLFQYIIDHPGSHDQGCKRWYPNHGFTHKIPGFLSVFFFFFFKEKLKPLKPTTSLLGASSKCSHWSPSPLLPKYWIVPQNEMCAKVSVQRYYIAPFVIYNF